MSRGTMSQSKWRRLRKYSAEHIREAKARAGENFARLHPMHNRHSYPRGCGWPKDAA